MMYNVTDWQDLEKWLEEILEDDRAMRPPNSGGTKKEEDVVGVACIAQCKATEQVNMTLLDKDIDRLLRAAELANKFPIFVSSTGRKKGITLVFDGNNDDIILSLLKIAAIKKEAEILLKIATSAKTARQINSIRKELKKLKRRSSTEIDLLKDVLQAVEKKCDTKYDDLTIVDLFEGEKNGS